MHTRKNQTRNRLQLLVIFITVVATLLAAYILSDEDSSSGEQTRVTLFMSYIPSVQFAPVYMAAERGYFADEGIDISFENSFNESDGVYRLGSNDLQFGLISGEQVVLARANDIPVVYIFEWYHNFPVGVVSSIELNITTPADLAGRVVGIPGPQGASYIGLRALLNAAGLDEDDLGELRPIGFTAPENICEATIEAALVYIVNEPLSIEQQCTPVNVIKVSDFAFLVSNGLVTNEQTIRDHPDLVHSMVRALYRGLDDVLAEPDVAFTLSVENYIPDLPAEQYDTQRQVLYNSLELWRSDTLGQTTSAAWEMTQDILLETGLLSAPLDDLTAGYDMSFLPE